MASLSPLWSSFHPRHQQRLLALTLQKFQHEYHSNDPKILWIKLPASQAWLNNWSCCFSEAAFRPNEPFSICHLHTQESLIIRDHLLQLLRPEMQALLFLSIYCQRSSSCFVRFEISIDKLQPKTRPVSIEELFATMSSECIVLRVMTDKRHSRLWRRFESTVYCWDRGGAEEACHWLLTILKLLADTITARQRADLVSWCLRST